MDYTDRFKDPSLPDGIEVTVMLKRRWTGLICRAIKTDWRTELPSKRATADGRNRPIIGRG